MTKYALILAGVLGLGSTVASAANVGLATQSVTNLGGGKYGYTIKVVTDDVMPGSYATSYLTFTGAINQVKGKLGKKFISVDAESDADAFDGVDTYTKIMDSWFFDSAWNPIAPQSDGPVETANSYQFSLGTASGVGYTSNVLLAYIVAGDSLSYSGIVAHNAKDYNVNGTFTADIPEPASMSLLALGGLALLRRARRA